MCQARALLALLQKTQTFNLRSFTLNARQRTFLKTINVTSLPLLQQLLVIDACSSKYNPKRSLAGTPTTRLAKSVYEKTKLFGQLGVELVRLTLLSQ